MHVDPRPSDLVKSLRGFGYRPATAIADLIDNSLSAGATAIRVEFLWDDAYPRLRVTDNGHGMTPEALVEAMRFGRDTTGERAKDDHGRFGLGLKTASFSQARVLTVCTKAQGVAPATRRWDIDHLAAVDKWDLQDGPLPGSDSFLAAIADMPCGTIVLWEGLDVLMGGTDGSIDAMFEIAEGVSRHIAMVFHRFLADGRADISVNGEAVRAWDPFMRDHVDCVVSGPQTLHSGEERYDVVVTGYVLPTRSRLNDDEYERAAGPMGWLAQQGFYVYRADRLLVAGSWLGIGRAGKSWAIDRKFIQARISLDITNASDLDWGIDVRKSMASPPAIFLKPLRQMAEEIRRRAKSSYRAFLALERSVKEASGAEVPIWIATAQSGPVPRFHINRRHPVVQALRSSVRDKSRLRALLTLIDREAPVQPRSTPVGLHAAAVDANRVLQEQSIRPLAAAIYYSLRNGRGMTREEAQGEMLAKPQFKEYEELVILVIDEFEGGRVA